MESRGHKPVLRGTRYVCANCGDFLLDVRTVARLRALEDVDPVKRSAVERRVLRDPKLAKRVDENPREVVSTYKLADKFNDFLMNPEARPDLQTPEAQQYLQLLQNTYLNDKTDELMPWLVREWKKGRIKANPETDPRGERFHMDFGPEYSYETPNGQTETYHSVAPDVLGHWADWYRSDHPSRRGKDIMQMKAPEFHQTIKDWDADMRQKAGEAAQVRGDVEHSYPDGWTVQRLNSEKALKDEGDSMGHCVGGYWPSVQRGDRLIYSLRDHQNEPHATWELIPTRYRGDSGKVYKRNELDKGVGPNADTVQPIPDNGEMVQIQGKANERPLPEYQKRIKDYIENKWPDPDEGRPYWADAEYSTTDEIEEGHLYGYHEGDYGLNQPNIDYYWEGIVEDGAEYGHNDWGTVIDAAKERDELPALQKAAEYAEADAEDNAKENARAEWEHYRKPEVEQEFEEEEDYDQPVEPDIYDFEDEEEGETAEEQYEKALEDYEREFEHYERDRERRLEQLLEQEEEDYIENYPHEDEKVQSIDTLLYDIRRTMALNRESKARPYHPRFGTGEPCNCTFTNYPQERNWYVSATMVCEACGDPLEHGKCKRCDWGQWSNAMGDENPTDVTREVKPAIQA